MSGHVIRDRAIWANLVLTAQGGIGDRRVYVGPGLGRRRFLGVRRFWCRNQFTILPACGTVPFGLRKGVFHVQLSSRDIDRFWSKVKISSGDKCWPWDGGSKHPKGYGLFTVATGMSGGKKYVSSRVACFLTYGEPPDGAPNALHSCDNPACCNPAHLRWGSQKANVSDAVERKRHKNPPRIWDHPEWVERRLEAVPRGEDVHNAKLTELDVRFIWRLHFEKKSVAEISRITGASQASIADVCRGRTWRHLESAPSVEDLQKGGVRRGFNQFSNATGPTRSIHPRTKLDDASISEIKWLASGGDSYRTIAEFFGVSKATIGRVMKL